MSKSKNNLVAVTMRLAPAVGYHEERDAISHDWMRLLTSLGLVPILIPNLSTDPESMLINSGASRILLTNGDSLGPLTGEPNGPAPTVRDQMEYRLMDYALDTRLPVLGVCRGLQLINAYFGGQVTRDLLQVSGEQHAACSHRVLTKPCDVWQEVNSFHAEGVMADQVAKDLSVTAVTPAGVVEGLQHVTLPVWAIQWHPERNGVTSSTDSSILYEWINA